MARPPSSSSRPPISAWRRWWQRWWAASPGAVSAAPATEPRKDERRSARTARRDQLYAVVRENMIRAGVLSSSYKFKVLTLDHEGTSHLVLIDIQATALDSVPEGTPGLEVQLQQLAQERLHLEVRAVYWRLLGATHVQKAPTRSVQAASETDHDPVEHDELAALQRALGERSTNTKHPSFEPTRPMTRRESERFSPLSETQLGNLE